MPDSQSSLQQNDRPTKIHPYKNGQSRMTVDNDQYPGRRRFAVITADSMLKVMLIPSEYPTWLVRCVAYAGTESHKPVLHGQTDSYGAIPAFNRELKAGEEMS